MIRNRWNDNEAERLMGKAGPDEADRQLALRVYTSRLIGADRDLVLHGGGNTSCKVVRRDIFGRRIDVLHIKGSGWDLATIEAAGLPGVRLAPLRELRALEALSDEDMVNLQRAALLDSKAPNPSVETLLHAFLPHRFIDHTHASAMLALADLPDAETVVQEIFEGRVACVPFIMPGFELARVAADVYESNPDVEGLLLLKHGHFAFGDSARESYDRLIEQTAAAESWLARKTGAVPAPATGENVQWSARAAEILPMLRGHLGKCSAEHAGNPDQPMPVMDLRNGRNVQEFFARDDLALLATRGVPTPDHVIRTKNRPLYLTREILSGGRRAVEEAVNGYITRYKAYFDENNKRFGGAKKLLDPGPRLAWIEGVGIVGIGADARAAGAASDLAAQAIGVMVNAQAAGGYFPVDETRLFDMEYWSLEQAKLGKGTPPPMQGRVVMITGAAGAIGQATAQAFADLGADIFLIDRDSRALADAGKALDGFHRTLALDITAEGAAEAAMAACIRAFGGLDILISNAGAAWSGEMLTLPDETLRESFDLNFFAHRNFATAAARLLCEQGRGGQILFNVSKQAVNPGRGFGAYGIPKAATMFLLRQLALELGPKGVRVNGVNADRIRSGLLDDAFIAERARARGVSEESYMAGNLLRREVEARHVAAAFVALACSERTTAHVMTVDGGNIEAALR